MSAATAIAKTQPSSRKYGLAYWMDRVLEECGRAAQDFAPDPVHDLRVALRRCRSVADGLRAVDPDPAWKQMKKSGKHLFGSLGELRDNQVIAEWMARLGMTADPASASLAQFLTTRDAELKACASQALRVFNRKQWRQWSGVLPRRAARLKAGSLIFQDLALERWAEAHALHRKAMRSRSQRAFHNLRIGIKRFRYLVENFLPAQHAAWKNDLKQVQDLLGEVHDLDVLWTTVLKVGAFSDPGARSRWQARIIEEQSSRLAEYSRKMTGKTSLWQVWRSQLPKGQQIASAGLSRLRVWASFRDPYVKHSAHVARLALQLYDGLIHNGHSAGSLSQNRALLRVAALLHHVGMSKSQKGFHKISYRLIRDMRLPHGWSPTELKMAAVVARYHRGVLPRAGQKELKALTPSQRQNARFLTGILRLANAFDVRRDGRIRRLEVRERNGFLVVAAEGYSAHDRIGAEVAAARHLLETVFRRPVIVRPLRPLKTAQQPRVKSRGNQ